MSGKDHKIELFRSDCYICRETERRIERIKPDGYDLIVYNIVNHPPSRIMARERGIKAAPSIYIDGELVFVGMPTEYELKKALNLVI